MASTYFFFLGVVMDFIVGVLFLFGVYYLFESLVTAEPEGPDVIVDSSHWDNIESSRDYETTLDMNNVLMSAGNKQAYLNSPEWANKRTLIVTRDVVCQCCGSIHANEVHHISYLHLGDEPLSDLVLVCRKCHQEIHDKYGYDRLGYFPLD